VTRNQRLVLSEARFAGLWLGLCFAAGFALTFPLAVRYALRHTPKE
jgi:hypothetical protein